MPEQNQLPFYPEYALRPDFYTTIGNTEGYLFQEQIYFIDGGDFCVDPSGRLYGGAEVFSLIDLHQVSYTFPNPGQPKPNSAFLWLHRDDAENVDKIKRFLSQNQSESWAMSVVNYIIKSLSDRINPEQIKNKILKYFIGNEEDIQKYFQELTNDFDNKNFDSVKNTLAKIYRRKRQMLLKNTQTELEKFQQTQNKDVLGEHAREQVFQQLQNVFNNEQTRWQALYVHSNNVPVIVFDKCSSFPRLIDDFGTRFGLADVNLKSIFLTMSSGYFDVKKYHDNLPILRNIKFSNYSNDTNIFNVSLTVEDPKWFSMYSPFDVRTHDFNLAQVAGEEFSDYCHSDIASKTNNINRLPLSDQQHQELRKFGENLENRLNYLYDVANKACNNTLSADEQVLWQEIENNNLIEKNSSNHENLLVRFRSQPAPKPGDLIKIESEEFSQVQFTVEKVEKSRLGVNLLLKGNTSASKSFTLRAYLYHIKEFLFRKSQVYTDEMFSIELFGRINSLMLLDESLTKHLTKELLPYRQQVNNYISNFINKNLAEEITEPESTQTPYFYAEDANQNSERNIFLIQNTSSLVPSMQFDNDYSRLNSRYPSLGFWSNVSNSSRSQSEQSLSLSLNPESTIMMQLMLLAGIVYLIRKCIASFSTKNQETHSNNDNDGAFSSFSL